MSVHVSPAAPAGPAPVQDRTAPGGRPVRPRRVPRAGRRPRAVVPVPVPVLLPALAAVCLGLWGVRRQGAVWQDEAVTYDMAHRTLPDLWATLGHADAVHGLYYLFMHALFAVWDSGGDAGVLTLRLPSVAATAVAAAGVAALGRRLAGGVAGLSAGLVFVLLPAVQRYAQEGRSYAVVCALVVWATHVLVRAATKARRTWWIGYGVLVAVSAVLHEFALLVLAAHGTTLFTAGVPRRARVAWAWCAVSATAVAAPLVVLSLRQSDQVSWIEVGLWGDVSGVALLALVCLTCAAVLRGSPPGRRRGERPAGPDLVSVALPLGLVPSVLLLAVSVVKPLYVDRYVLYGMAGVALLTGTALAGLWRHPGLRLTVAVLTAAAAIALVLPVGAQLRSPDSRSEDVNSLGRTVDRLSRPGDGLLFLPASRRVWIPPAAVAASGVVDLALAEAPAESHTLYGVELPASLIRDRMVASERIVVLRERGREGLETGAAEDVKRATLRSRFLSCHHKETGTAAITVYARSGRC